MTLDAERAKSLFLAALDLVADSAERAAFLDRECGGDAELRSRVEALLRANDAASLPTAADANRTAAYTPSDPNRTEDHGDPTVRIGALLAGKYKLIEEIGEGGMGSVFLAQQTAPVKRDVAVKVIKAGMDSRAVLARFEAERQALAMMDHPNIETANALNRDIQRYLADEVVEARPPSVGYRLKKLVRRHKGQVIAASLVLLALVGGVIGTTAGLFEARRQAAIAGGKEREANEEKHKALAAAEEERQSKEREAERAEGERQAEIEAEAKRKEAERNLAFAKKGNAILGSVFAGLDPKKIAESGRPLQDVLRQNLRRAVKEREGSALGEPLEVAAMQDTLGQSLVGLGEYALAVEVLNKVLAARQAKLGPDHPYTLTSMNNLAAAYKTSGQLVKAVLLLDETLAKRKAKLGPDHPQTIASMNNLALAYRAGGQLDKAVPLLKETLEKRKVQLGAEHPHTLLNPSRGVAATPRQGTGKTAEGGLKRGWRSRTRD